MDYQAILNEFDSWPIDDRVRLVRALWDRLVDEGVESELTEEMKVELDRRIEELDRDPDAGVPWEKVKAKAIGHIRK